MKTTENTPDTSPPADAETPKHHHALDDARDQARHLMAILSLSNVKVRPPARKESL